MIIETWCDFQASAARSQGPLPIALAAGAALPKDLTIDGRSFLPQLRGRKGHPREWVLCHYFRDPGDPVQRFARDKRRKLYQTGALFDLQADPHEQRATASHEENAPATRARQRLQLVLDSLR